MDHPADSIRLEVFKHLFTSIPEEMGVVLRRSSYSPNIKERRDFSCAIFNPQGDIISQAAHIPVHLGSMPLSVKAAIEAFSPASILHLNNHSEENSAGSLMPGDVIILNDPYRGGTHLPDITMVTPVFIHEVQDVEAHLGTSKAKKPKKPTRLLGFVASRAHHSDVGGITPGSMPIAREIYQEGLIIPPVKLVSQGKVNQDVLSLILANVRTPQERSGDIWAQIAANERGVTRLRQLAGKYGQDEIFYFMNALLDYTERITRNMLTSLPDGAYRFTDFMDDDGIENQPIPITATIRIDGDHAIVDFTGSAPQQKGSINAVYAITLSAVFYVIRCLIAQDIPNNSGCLRPIHVIAPEGSIVNASRPAPVAGGNVETSQRIVDVLLGALAQASPSRIPAASQGTMNNLTIGGWDPGKSSPFAYYETIGGGMGALPTRDGYSAIHSHMTNTLNTPVEALEYAYPFHILKYEIRRASGGKGKYTGGDGIRRDIQLLTDAQISIISERRSQPPYGLQGGQPGMRGENVLIRDSTETQLPGKGTFYLKSGDIVSIRTPGGGGYGDPEISIENPRDG